MFSKGLIPINEIIVVQFGLAIILLLDFIRASELISGIIKGIFLLSLKAELLSITYEPFLEAIVANFLLTVELATKKTKSKPSKFFLSNFINFYSSFEFYI